MSIRKFSHYFGALSGLVVVVALGLSAAVAAAYLFVYPSLPPAETIKDIPLQVPLRVYTRDGRLIAEIGEQRRIPVAYDDIPPMVEHAFLAAEDDRFYGHPGVDYQGVLRSLWVFAKSGRMSQGGSTITQQLARDYFLTRERKITRKIREAFLAYRIEQEFSKQEIFAMFVNKMFFGKRAHGVAAAAQIYFDKTLAELNVAEAATLAGVLPAPSRYNPARSPKNALSRRGYVLQRMLDIGYIDEPAYQTAMDYPLESELHGPDIQLPAPFIAEMVRLEMIKMAEGGELKDLGDDIYTGGYRVFTTLDSTVQRSAVHGLRNGLLEYDRRHGYRGALERVEIDAETRAGNAWPKVVSLALDSYPRTGGLRPACVLDVHDDNGITVALDADERVRIDWTGISWAKPYVDDNTVGDAPESASDVVSVGDIIYVMPTRDGGHALAQTPRAQSAFVALDPNDGAIVALSGGFDYSISKYNRAIQAKRQPGSSFKPFIYSAALENGLTPATIINDAPVVFDSEELEGLWKPKNYSGRFYGPTRVRQALVRSQNLVSVRILMEIGLKNAIQHIRKFGFDDDSIPRDFSLALGSGAASTLNMAQGYAVFANGGFSVAPYFIDQIKNSDGEQVFRAQPKSVCRECPDIDDKKRRPPRAKTYASAAQLIDKAGRYRPAGDAVPAMLDDLSLAPRVISEQNAFLVSDMMRDVIKSGTGRRARALGRGDLSGKTGTSNDRRDAWFGGFNANLVATTWVGFDADVPLGNGEEGSATALPIWINVMETALAGTAEHKIAEPDGLVTVRVSAVTGERARADDTDTVFELFIAGTEPQRQTTEPVEDFFNAGFDDETGEDSSLF